MKRNVSRAILKAPGLTVYQHARIADRHDCCRILSQEGAHAPAGELRGKAARDLWLAAGPLVRPYMPSGAPEPLLAAIADVDDAAAATATPGGGGGGGGGAAGDGSSSGGDGSGGAAAATGGFAESVAIVRSADAARELQYASELQYNGLVEDVQRADAATVRAKLARYDESVINRVVKGWTLLLRACTAGKDDIVRVLVERLANINCAVDDPVSEFNGMTPCHIAVVVGSYATVQALLGEHSSEEGHDAADEESDAARAANAIPVNAPMLCDATPLHFACALVQQACAEVLVLMGAKPYLRDKRGKTPIETLMETAVTVERSGIPSAYGLDKLKITRVLVVKDVKIIGLADALPADASGPALQLSVRLGRETRAEARSAVGAGDGVGEYVTALHACPLRKAEAGLHSPAVCDRCFDLINSDAVKFECVEHSYDVCTPCYEMERPAQINVQERVKQMTVLLKLYDLSHRLLTAVRLGVRAQKDINDILSPRLEVVRLEYKFVTCTRESLRIIDATDSLGNTALMLTVKNLSYRELHNSLLKFQPNLTLRNRSGWSAQTIAQQESERRTNSPAQQADYRYVRDHLDYVTCGTKLMKSSKTGQLQSARELVAAAATKSALYAAVAGAPVQAVMERRVTVDARGGRTELDSAGPIHSTARPSSALVNYVCPALCQTPLFAAVCAWCRGGLMKALGEFYYAFANPSERLPQRESHGAVVRLLLQNGADPNTATKGMTPIHVAIQSLNVPAVAELLRWDTVIEYQRGGHLDSPIEFARKLRARFASKAGALPFMTQESGSIVNRLHVMLADFLVSTLRERMRADRLAAQAASGDLDALKSEIDAVREEVAEATRAETAAAAADSESDGSSDDDVSRDITRERLIAALNAKGREEATALHRAAGKGSLECVLCLLEMGAAVDQLDVYGRTAFDRANVPATAGDGDVDAAAPMDRFRVVVEELRVWSFVTQFMQACEVGNFKYVKELLTTDSFMDEKARSRLVMVARSRTDGTNRTPLHVVALKDESRTAEESVKSPYFKIMRLLLVNGAFEHQFIPTGNTRVTPLHCTALNGNAVGTKMLCDAARSCAQDIVGRELGLDAESNASDERVAARVSSVLRGLVDSVDVYDRTPLMIAAMTCAIPIVRELVGCGADPSRVDKSRKTPLHYACQFMETASDDALQLLHDIVDYNPGGAVSRVGGSREVKHLEAVDQDGQTALTICCIADKLSFCNVILGALAQMPLHLAKVVNMPDKFGRTPLVYAVINNSSALVAKLLEAGAKPELIERSTGTAVGAGSSAGTPTLL